MSKLSSKPLVPLILGLDTSCDDTSAAVVRGQTILSNVVASQTQLHKPYGGVFPTVAKQAHQANVQPTIALALRRAKVTWADITAIAVTVGPGLAPALEVGVSTAKQLALTHHKPVIGVNHMAGHALSGLLRQQHRADNDPQLVFPPQVQWPVLAVTVSGGHTEFVLIKNFTEFQIMGKTVDDAAGECLDKVGRMLNLGYPAGPVIEEFALLGDSKRFAFPLPMTTVTSFNMSFSGLKTAARNLLAELTKEKPLTQQDIYDFAASFQRRVFDHITYKLHRLLSEQQVNQPISEVWLGGGVAANTALRQALRTTLKPFGLRLVVPLNTRVCSDNGAMIALVGGILWQQGRQSDIATLERQPRLALS